MSDSFEKEISALYRNASQEAPPEHMDDAILALARRETPTKPKVVSPFAGRWTLPFSLAAVIVLSVSVVTLVEKESPPSGIENLNVFNSPQEMTTPPSLGDETKSKVKPSAERSASKKEKTLLERKPAAPATPALEMKKTLPTPPVHKKIEAPAEADMERPGLKKPVAKKSKASKSEASKSKPLKLMAPQSSAPLLSREAVPPAAEETTTSAGIKQAGKPTNPQAPHAAGFMAEEPAMNARKSKPRESIPALAGTQTQSSSSPLPPSRPREGAAHFSASSEAQALTTPTSPQPCESLTANQCLQSPSCTYTRLQAGQHYQCREALKRCEKGFVQFDAITGDSAKTLCERKPGCRFIPGNCQCAEGQACDCRGKNPPQCKEQ